MAQTALDNKELVRQAIDGFDHRDFDAVEAVHAPNVVVHDDGTTFEGYDAFEEQMAATLEVTDASFTIDQLIAEDDTVAVRYTVDGLTEGDAVSQSFLGLLSIDDGTITEVWVASC